MRKRREKVKSSSKKKRRLKAEDNKMGSTFSVIQGEKETTERGFSYLLKRERKGGSIEVGCG